MNTKGLGFNALCLNDNLKIKIENFNTAQSKNVNMNVMIQFYVYFDDTEFLIIL